MISEPDAIRSFNIGKYAFELLALRAIESCWGSTFDGPVKAIMNFSKFTIESTSAL